MTTTCFSRPLTHTALREATAEQHHRLDRGLHYLLSGHMDVDRYVKLLSGFYGFYVPLEDELVRWHAASSSTALPLVRRAGLLERDLRVFGRTPDSVPMCEHTPAFAGEDQAAGALYVVEGACLGGQLIARALNKDLGITRDTGCAFFTGDGRHTRGRWRQVLAWLDARGSSVDRRELIVSGARLTFTALAQWLKAQEILDE